MNRELHIGDAVTFREEAFEGLRKSVPWLADITWSDWTASKTMLTVDDERPRINLSERRLLAVRTSDGDRCNVWPSDIKLDDRAQRKWFHDAIEAMKAARRAAKKTNNQKRGPRHG